MNAPTATAPQTAPRTAPAPPAPHGPRMTRDELARASTLGGGSLLHHALAVSADPGAPFLHSEHPLLGPDGIRRRDFTLTELDGLARTWSAWYLDRGIGPHDRVAVYLTDSFEDVLHFLALSQIGAIPVLVNGRLAAETAAGLYERTGASGLFTDSAHRDALRTAGVLDGLTVLGVSDELASLAAVPLADADRFRHAPGDPVLISHSSGTTGVPKAVIWTHEGSVAALRELLLLPQPAEREVMLSAVPQSHQAGASFAAGALLFGARLIALADRSGAHVAAAIAEHRPHTVVAFAQTYAELAALEPGDEVLASVERWFNTGDSAHGRHIAPLVRAGAVFIDGLGSSELGFAQFGQVTTADTVRHDRCIGRPHPWARVAVLREDGTDAPRGEAGLLGVKGPTLTPGYWNDQDRYYRSRLGGWFLSGDVVREGEDGNYFHLDRAVDVIHTAHGPAYSLLMEEALLGALPALDDCTVVGVPDGAGAESPVAVLRPRDPDADAEGLRTAAGRALAEAGLPALAAVRVARTAAEVPLGPSGKVLKRHLRLQLADALTATDPGETS